MTLIRMSRPAASSNLRVQLDRFVDLFGRWPSFLDGHHGCHARPELATPVLVAAQQVGTTTKVSAPR